MPAFFRDLISQFCGDVGSYAGFPRMAPPQLHACQHPVALQPKLSLHLTTLHAHSPRVPRNNAAHGGRMGSAPPAGAPSHCGALGMQTSAPLGRFTVGTRPSRCRCCRQRQSFASRPCFKGRGCCRQLPGRAVAAVLQAPDGQQGILRAWRITEGLGQETATRREAHGPCLLSFLLSGRGVSCNTVIS